MILFFVVILLRAKLAGLPGLYVYDIITRKLFHSDSRNACLCMDLQTYVVKKIFNN